jgi:hypothetical protein
VQHFAFSLSEKMGKVKAPAPKAKKYMTVEELALTIDRVYKKSI